MYLNEKFREELLFKLSMENINNKSNGLEKFLATQVMIQNKSFRSAGVLNKLAPHKKKCINNNNNTPFMIKTLTQAHRKRSHL